MQRKSKFSAFPPSVSVSPKYLQRRILSGPKKKNKTTKTAVWTLFYCRLGCFYQNFAAVNPRRDKCQFLAFRRPFSRILKEKEEPLCQSFSSSVRDCPLISPSSSSSCLLFCLCSVPLSSKDNNNMKGPSPHYLWIIVLTRCKICCEKSLL